MARPNCLPSPYSNYQNSSLYPKYLPHNGKARKNYKNKKLREKKKSKLTFSLLKEFPKPEMNLESLKNQSRDPEVKKNVGIF